MASKTVTKCHNQNNSEVNESTTTPIPSDLDNLPKAKILTKSSSEARVSASSISPSNLAHDRTYLCNETLAQYPDLYCQFSSEEIDYYYRNTDESLCPLCKLNHDDDGIEGRYESGFYYIKCEQREIEIVA